MPSGTVHAIVLRRQDSGESDRRLTLFTREHGKLDVVAKGARKSASRLGSVSEPLAMAAFTLAGGKRNDFIVHAQPLHAFRRLRTDYDRLSYALAYTELFAAVTPYGQPLDGMFEVLARSLGQLDDHVRPEVAMLWAELRLLLESGHLPSFDVCVVTDTPVQKTGNFLSPSAGGLVCHQTALQFTDRVETRFEILAALTQTARLLEPPSQVKYAKESLVALAPFWKYLALCPLPAHDHFIGHLQHELTGL
jgi:DNA repair protein RecO (recombination protein O)